MISPLMSAWKRRWDTSIFTWFDRRAPLSEEHILHRRNLYILPTGTGLTFLFLALIIWLLGTNYQNNLILALAYFQISLFVVTILNTYNNLAGLRIRHMCAQRGFVGEGIEFEFEVQCRQRQGSRHVSFNWQHQKRAVYDFESNDVQRINVTAVATGRGHFGPGRLLVQSSFPMGLVKCWSWLNVEAKALAYPAPIVFALEDLEGKSTEQEGAQAHPGGDDFRGLHPYRPGQPIKHIAWKHYARGLGLHSKEYGHAEAGQTLLDWQQFYRGDIELALSQLCFCALELAIREQVFELRLPCTEIPPGQGDAHLTSVLTALAEFRLE